MLLKSGSQEHSAKEVMKRLILAFLIFVPLGCAVHQQMGHETVHLVVSYKPDRYVEVIFATKAAALKYIQEYKEHHEYYYEEATVNR